MYMYVWVHVCHDLHMEVTEELYGIGSFLLPNGTWILVIQLRLRLGSNHLLLLNNVTDLISNL